MTNQLAVADKKSWTVQEVQAAKVAVDQAPWLLHVCIQQMALDILGRVLL